VFSLAFYFLEYAVRSSPAVMIPELAKTFGVSALGVSDILGTYHYTYSTASLVAGVVVLLVAVGLWWITPKETPRILQGKASGGILAT
jgi:TctA family transporter